MEDKYLIVGASGLLGTSWARHLSDICAKFFVTQHKQSINIDNVIILPDELPRIPWLISLIETKKISHVINCAGITNVDLCEANKTLAHNVNTLLPTLLAKACAHTGSKLIHISTDHLFTGNDEYASENDLIAPQNYYAQTKADAEREVLTNAPSSLIIRSNFYGTGPIYRESFSDFIINNVRNRKNITLFDDVIITPMFIPILIKLIHQMIAMDVCGIYHLSSDNGISKYQFGILLADTFKLDKNFLRRGTFASNQSLIRRPLNMTLNNEKSVNLLENPIGTVEQHLQFMYQYENMAGSEV